MRSLLLFVIFYSLLANANQNVFDRATSSATCDPELPICEYRPINTSVGNMGNLVNKVTCMLFHERDCDILGEGYMRVDQITRSHITFYHKDPKVRTQMATALQRFDRGSEFSVAPGGYAKVEVNVFIMESQGFDNFMFQISPAWDPKGGSISMIPRLASSMSDSGLMGITLGLGNLTTALLKLKFDFSRINSWAQILPSYNRSVAVGDDIGINDSTLIWTGDGTTPYSKQDSIGLNMNGKVQVHPQDPRRIQIKNLSVNYGLPTGEVGSLVQRINLFSGNSDLIAGEPMLMISKEVSVTRNKKQNNFIFAAGSNKESERSRLAIFLTVTPITSNIDPDKRADGANNGMLNANDIRNLPQGDSSSIQQILDSVRGQIAWGTMLDSFGQRISLLLDSRLLTQSNFNKTIKVRIKHLGSKTDAKEMLTDVQTLALVGLSLPPLNIEEACKDKSQCQLLQYLVSFEIDSRVHSSKGISGTSILHLQHIPDAGKIDQKLIPFDQHSEALRQMEVSRWFNFNFREGSSD